MKTKNKKRNFIPYLDPERQTYYYLNKYRDGDEEVEWGQPSDKDYWIDIYLPEGYKKFNWSKGTIVMIKRRLLFDTIIRYKFLFEQNKEKWNANTCVLVYEELCISKSFLEKQTDDTFIIISLDELKEKLEADFDDVIEDEKQKDWRKERENIIAEAQSKFQRGNNVFVLGAGVSMNSGLPSWDKLLERILTKAEIFCSLDELKEQCAHSSLIMARYLRLGLGMNRSDKKDKFNQLIYDSIYQDGITQWDWPNAIAEAVQTKKVKSIITYNYDNLIEQALDKHNISCWPIYKGNRNDSVELPIYHVHGLLDKEEKYDKNPVLCEEDYHEQYRDVFLWSNIEQLHAFNRSTCFLVGLSMDDPNLRRLLEISKANGADPYNHFVFLKREGKENGNENKVNAEELKKLEEKNRMKEKMMSDLGLKVIWMEDFNEFPELLSQICN